MIWQDHTIFNSNSVINLRNVLNGNINNFTIFAEGYIFAGYCLRADHIRPYGSAEPKQRGSVLCTDCRKIYAILPVVILAPPRFSQLSRSRSPHPFHEDASGSYEPHRSQVFPASSRCTFFGSFSTTSR